jgi:cobyrinic acid a,c-diamide synthase
VVRLPRLVVAAPASGHGKTTVATGLMAALRAAGHVVSGHKVGPDYIDPGYHTLATGRAGRNLDPHLVGEDLLVPLLLHGAASPVPADIAVIEGVMGLYDGAIGRDGFASTAHVASVLGAPVVLVVDVSHASRTIAAVVHGMVSFDTGVRIAGVILNKAGSQRHADEVRDALEVTGVPVLGVISRDDGIVAPSRHLGLIPVEERPEAEAAVQRLAAQVASRVDLETLVRIARGAPALSGTTWDPTAALAAASSADGYAGPRTPATEAAGSEPVLAVAGGRAFTFRYPETEELLQAAGCRTVAFDPMNDPALPQGTAGIYLGGGFPEVHAAGLSANEPLREALAAAIAAGVPTVAECAGLLYLCRTVDGLPMVGAVDAHARMTPRLTLSYHAAVAPADTLLARAGRRVTGHEFHRTTVEPGGVSGDVSGGVSGAGAAWLLDGRPAGFSLDPAGTGAPTLHASYLHTHWAGATSLAARFAEAAHARAAATPAAGTQRHGVGERRPRRPAAATTGALHAGAAGRPVLAPASGAVDGSDVDLLHHGDRELADGLVDLAVNVYRGARPGWLDDALRRSLDDLDRYPDFTRARKAVAHRHARRPEEVLPTAGAAEAFTLLARMRAWRHPVVVHPQFTEPEAALRAAGHTVGRVVLDERDGFRLDPAAVPDEADLVVVGNPTNPTGVLHPAATLTALARPGRTLVVDEAFMDAVAGERESLTSRVLPGVVVLRSLTKTWSVPGVRAGYLLAAADTVALAADQQPPWSVSATAAAAMVACSTAEALTEAARRAHDIEGWRRVLVGGLADLGLPVAGDPATPFVLLRGPLGLREALRDAGYAVRRGDTFPGLGPAWVRIAVRDPATTRGLLSAIASLRARAAQREPAR